MVDMKRFPGVTKRKGRKYLLISWFVNGRRFRETTKTEDPQEAYTLLCKRIAETADGAITEPRVGRIKFDELLADVLTNYENKGNRSYKTAKYRIDKHIKPHFGYRRVIAITSAEIEKYIRKRREEQASNGTIRQEL